MKAKRFLAAIIVAAMFISVMSLSAFAADEEVTQDVQTIAEETVRPEPPKAEVTVLPAMKLTAFKHDYMMWPSGDSNIDRPLEVVMNFKTTETPEEFAVSKYRLWRVDFYLTLTGLANGSVEADNCYLAGNYGSFGWIVIPTDDTVLENGVTYPVVSAYDGNITYKQIYETVKDFTAAIHIDDAILEANPNFKVTLELRMTNPDNEEDVIVVGEPASYTVEDLRAPIDKQELDRFGENNAVVDFGAVKEDESAPSSPEVYRIATLATIDSLNYSNVGFAITLDGATLERSTNVVYDVIKAADAETDEINDYKASDFGGDGKYIFGQMIDFAARHKGKLVSYKPFATKFSGEVVYGKETTITIGE